MKVFVGLSGGVDSAVAASRLQAAGYEVVGVFIKVWHPDFLVCNWESERRDAMRVAAHLGIPFLTCDAETAYYEHVARYFIDAYQAGETPNPDVMCNREVKFGTFWHFAKAHGADYIATGHYAQNLYNQTTSRYELHRGSDTNKDQTYFLWTLTQVDLAHTLFPVGDSPKEQIRAEAHSQGLPTATKQDSQGICFLGHVNIPEFLGHFIDLQPGPVTDTSGMVIGSHQGSVCYTIGQRHGFKVTEPAYASLPTYIQKLDHSTNTIVVNTKPPQRASQTELVLRSVNMIESFTIGTQYQIQLRYRQDPILATISDIYADRIKLLPNEAVDDVAIGQSCVLYDRTHCMGGGIIAT